MPRPFEIGDLVHGIEVETGLLLALASGKEVDADEAGRTSPAQREDSPIGDFLGSDFGAVYVGGAGSDHVGFEETALEVDVVVFQSFEDLCQDFLGDLLGLLDAVRPVAKDLGLHDRHQSVHLADRRVTGQTPGVLLNRQLAGTMLVDFQDRPPFREPTPHVVVLFAASGQSVQTRGPTLVLAQMQSLDALVHLDAR